VEGLDGMGSFKRDRKAKLSGHYRSYTDTCEHLFPTPFPNVVCLYCLLFVVA